MARSLETSLEARDLAAIRRNPRANRRRSPMRKRASCSRTMSRLEGVIELPINHPELFERVGIDQPKSYRQGLHGHVLLNPEGVLMCGPPGTGKTLFARAVAHHTSCISIRVSGSELVQKYVGEGACLVRELFVMARQHAPSIIFMDGIDSIGSVKIGNKKGPIYMQVRVLMAMNRLHVLDPALLRPGRIHRKIEFPNPTQKAVFEILKIHSRKMNLTRGIDFNKVAEKLNGPYGGELKVTHFVHATFVSRFITTFRPQD
ncbi:26S proteasome regulatory subunit 8 homolog A-like protein [Drosera capensis]